MARLWSCLSSCSMPSLLIFLKYRNKIKNAHGGHVNNQLAAPLGRMVMCQLTYSLSTCIEQCLSWVFINNKLMQEVPWQPNPKERGLEIMLKRTLIKVKETVKMNFSGFWALWLINITRNVLLLTSMSLLVLCKIFAASGVRIILFLILEFSLIS